MLINCSECGKEISSKAETCIGCGAPVTDESTGSGVAKLTTTQGTSKSLKLQMALSVAAMAVGFVMIYAAYDLGHESFGPGAILMLAGFLWYFVTRIRTWWHHS